MFERTRKIALLVASLLAGATIIPPAARSADKYERKVPYTGRQLTGITVMCKASLLAAADFWRDEATTTVHQGARIEQEAKPTYWRIAFVGPFVGQSGTAQVIRFSANAEALEASIIFTAEITAGGGLLFVKKTREPGTSPETISIDPLNSSFVYSSQHANYMWNRANIWYGACTQYE